MTTDQLFNILNLVLKVSLISFMVGSLLDMGLRLKLREALKGLKNVRFVALSLLWGFVLCPALAYGLTKIIPLESAYAVGIILLGMAPCAPFLPLMVDKAHGDLAYAAAFMLLTSVVTVAYMPFAVPIMVEGLSADAWTIAKPLLLYLMIPMAIGLVFHSAQPVVADKIEPFVKKTTGIATLVMLLLCIVVYAKGFMGAVGTYAIGTQILFFLVAIAAPYLLSFGLKQEQKSVLSLGVGTRNLGAAFAPLFTISSVDQRAIVIIALGVPMQTIFAWLAARWFGHRASSREPAAAQNAGGFA